ncbi:Sister chromatid cohesion protein pds5 [Ophidiomyces ophidiicola]|nr:Sister chromatid cohesion protein pds5 [Ophidiomyces ophidiicola]KAI2014824.1 Sister chromatid cohesion protein pds5 [Ophidiomyces ophidiicola]KAI2046532.1 Sister chromatid cohesion protein pds5 [Ophidiomyces ophidiicola]KAI2076955.1 Sister chromatid cohesion protein pds5 [Ophidiomyces ophidiicola]KAI2131842.1 Sister chromatid cohesion protein pds5 [Ophidiomyces ophidiicola]
MPSRTRQARQPAPEVVEEEQAGGLRRLRFNEPISWRAGKAILVADLLRRLEVLAAELRELDQEETDRDSLTKVSQDLASGHLLGHRDKGVRAWAACCVVDILRLCAPDAPFTANQLKDIFTMIITSIIPALANPSNAYNDQHVYVLSSLAEVKSIILLTDLDAPDTLILPLFSSCFDIVSGSSKASSGEPLAKNVEYDMARLLVPVIDEASSLAPEVIDVIIAQFLRVDPRLFDGSGGSKSKKDAVIDTKQATLWMKDYPPAYNMAKAICSACSEKMTSYVSQYFNNVIIDASDAAATGNPKRQRHGDPVESDDEGENIKELDKAHRLIRELWRACPDVLQNVIPQLEAELSAESMALRLLATQTIGDMISGIGVAGPPPAASMDPALYPPVSLCNEREISSSPNTLQTPLSPKPFSQAHSSAYESFLTRRHDKSASVRAAWATAIGRILLTTAGGSGLSGGDEKELVEGLRKTLIDADEKVRIAAVKVLGTFTFYDVIKKLGIDGGLSEPDSLLSTLAERVKDRKHAVRQQSMPILGTMWAVAAGEIEANNEEVVLVLKDAPSRILEAFYTNSDEVHILLDHIIFEVLLPLTYPPIKAKHSKAESSQSQKTKTLDDEQGDPDTIRVRRILTLAKNLDEKSKPVFFALQDRQLKMRTFLTFYLQACEDYNGGVMDENEEEIKARLTKVIDMLSKTFPDSSLVSADLWKFAKMHDRRGYQLLRFAMAAASDYRTVAKAIRELSSRIQSSTSATSSMLSTLLPLVYRSSALIFNKSHVPAIMKLSRTDEFGLGTIAHEMLREISTHNPEVLEAHVQEMCKDLETQAPTSNRPDEPGAEEILKACAGFAKKLPSKLPKERKFLVALCNYALYSSFPHAAKNAVTILMAASDKKQMHTRDLIRKCIQKCSYGSEHFLTKLATISQLNLLAAREVDEESDTILDIATKQILLTNLHPQPNSDYAWSDKSDEETSAKEWALRILVNRVRSKEMTEENENEFREYASPVFTVLNTLIVNNGELSRQKDTPPNQKSRLRLLAAKSVLKLCAARPLCDQLFSPSQFNHIALVAMDPAIQVRMAFISQLKKKLVQQPQLSSRWYTITFLLAFEPNASLHDSTLTWLRSRTAFYSRQSQSISKSSDQQTLMESLFARLLSLLAHHPDYPPESSDSETITGDLLEFTRYILFYLSAIANEKNLSLIFHIAQRVKQTKDAISDSDNIVSSRLHVLSDLSQATIRQFAELYSQQHKIGGSSGSGAASILQTYPGKMRLPSSLFATLSSHQEAHEITTKNFLPPEVDDRLEKVVRSFMKPKPNRKRKIELTHDENARDDKPDSVKKQRKGKSSRSLPVRKKSLPGSSATKPTRRKKGDEDNWTSDDGSIKKKAGASSDAARRRSGRGLAKAEVSYVEEDSDEADLEMNQWATNKVEKKEAGLKDPKPAESDSDEELSELSSLPDGDDEISEHSEPHGENSDDDGMDNPAVPPRKTRRASRSEEKSPPPVAKATRGRPAKSGTKVTKEKPASKAGGGRSSRKKR